MGNRRSVEKAFEHVGADVALTGDHDAIRGADGVVVPGVGAFPEAMRRLSGAGLDERDPRARRRGDAGARHLPRHAAAVRGLRGARGRRGARACCPAGSRRWSRGRSCRTSAGTTSRSSAPSRADARGSATAAAFYHVHSFVVPAARGRRRRAARRVRRAVRLDRRARQRLRRPVPPGEVLARRAGAAGATSRSRRCRRDPLPGDRHPRRQGGAPRPGPLRRPDRLPRRPARGRARVGRGGRALPARRRPRRRALRRAAVARAPRADRARAGVPVQYGGGLRSLPAVRDALRRAPSA